MINISIVIRGGVATKPHMKYESFRVHSTPPKIVKINNIASELEKIAETNNKIDLLQKLRDIPSKTLKFVATNQSLYV